MHRGLQVHTVPRVERLQDERERRGDSAKAGRQRKRELYPAAGRILPAEAVEGAKRAAGSRCET